jgi:hypothetical protein
MIEWLFWGQVWVCSAAAALNLVLAIFGRLPSLVSVGANALVFLGLLIQLVTGIVLTAQGAPCRGDVVEFFGYVIVAMLVPLGAVFWALIERTKTSTLVLAIAPFTVVVMVARMQQIWGLF